GDRAERFPDAALEGRAVHLDRHVIERAEVAAEVRADATANRGARRHPGERRVESRTAEGVAREREMKRADGRVDGVDQHGLLLQDNQMAAAAYARQGRQRSARSRSADGASSSAWQRPRSADGNASGSPSALKAITCAVQSPIPGISQRAEVTVSRSWEP